MILLRRSGGDCRKRRSTTQGIQHFLNLCLGFLTSEISSVLTEALGLESPIYIALKILKSGEYQDKQGINKSFNLLFSLVNKNKKSFLAK